LLAKPLTLRFAPAPFETSLKDYRLNCVFIEPLATFSAMDDFLYPLMNAMPQDSKGRPAMQAQVCIRHEYFTTMVVAFIHIILSHFCSPNCSQT
jgi:hypothetical protein